MCAEKAVTGLVTRLLLRALNNHALLREPGEEAGKEIAIPAPLADSAYRH
ncbi:hypothetical protein ACONUD_17855 [Microbulbifer harenosus]|nr:hypothetical protein [Microbulbifer harenosus]